MSDNKNEILIDTFANRDVPEAHRFGNGVSTLAEVQESLDRRDAFRNEQNEAAARGGRVRH